VYRCYNTTVLRILSFLVLVVSCVPGAAQPYIISTIAGGAPPPTPLEAIQASIGVTSRVATAPDGSVHFTSLHCVFKIDSNGILTRVAGNARLGYFGDGGVATLGQLNGPTGIAFDRSGNLFIADTLNSVVRRVSRDGVITTYAGTSIGFSGDGGLASKARLFSSGRDRCRFGGQPFHRGHKQPEDS
jgi:hypothetical protein